MVLRGAMTNSINTSRKSRRSGTACVVVFVLLASCSGVIAEPDGWQPASPSGDAGVGDSGPSGFEGTGAEVFASVCATCHGPTGEGTARAYELRHPVREYSTFVVRNGRPGLEFPMSQMSAYDTSLLSDLQLEEILDFLSDMPQPTTGEGLYLDYCANCHGADALGGVVGQDLDEKTFTDILTQVREGDGDNNYALRDMYMPSWTNAELSDAEVQLISDYLGTLSLGTDDQRSSVLTEEQTPRAHRRR